MPDQHPYVRGVLPSAVRHVLGGRSVGWAPDPIWDTAWLGQRLDDVDVVHVHFGFDSLDDDALTRWLALLERHAVALVLTVHDLRNPHHVDPAAHDRQLHRLIAAAAHLFTLTPGAAQECERRFGRLPEVVAHGTLLTAAAPLLDVAAAPPHGNGREVLVPLKALRANVVDPLAVLQAVVAGAGSARVRVLLHPVEHRRTDVEAVRTVAAGSAFELDVRPYLSDEELLDAVLSAHLLVLPYRFGTHSGWVELCHDVGTAVLAPDCGWFAQQWSAVRTYGSNERTGLDAGSLSTAVEAALRVCRPQPADRTARLAERARVRATHLDRYRQVAHQQPVTR